MGAGPWGGREVLSRREVTAEVKRDGGFMTEERGKGEWLLLRSVKRHRNKFCVKETAWGETDIPGDLGGRVMSLWPGGLRHPHRAGLMWESLAGRRPGQRTVATSESSSDDPEKRV